MKRIVGVLAVLAMVALLAACGEKSVEQAAVPSPTRAPSGWQRLADLPLSARAPGVLISTGTEVFAIGGDSSNPCPPNADCSGPENYESDGAALNLETGAWRTIAASPAQIPDYSSSALVNRHILVCIHTWQPKETTRLLDYDVTADTWTEREIPQDTPCQPIAVGNRVVFFSGTDENGVLPDRVLDLDTNEWSTLPEDPIGPAFDRAMVPTPHGLFLSAKELVRNPGAEKPSLTLIALLDPETDTWQRLPDTEQIGGWQWTWTGRHLLSPELETADGGDTGNWGRAYPYGGIIELPSGAWSELPDAPEPDYGSQWAVGTLGTRYSNTGGYVYDDEEETWARFSAPKGGPEFPGPAVWADDKLIVVGGTDWDDESGGSRSKGVWQFTP